MYNLLPNIEAKSELHPNGDKVISADSHTFSYHVIKKQKGKWVELARVYVAGDCCLAVAKSYLKANGYDEKIDKNIRIWDNSYWNHIQHSQHLREVGINHV